ncbi:MAG: hypothetical protein SW833_06430 [Cyanobacteriota bacterium]|nr:hypothetical protein [Cyanobacteriota bacterium]
MNHLNPATLRRLQRVPQVNSVWEGDRRPLGGMARELDPDALGSDGSGDCIIWVDGSEGMVRAMDIVSSEMGPEAVVRTLLRAIENPHSPAHPSRPQKIVVRDREIHFFLRGMLQNLDIDIDYVRELPLIEELFRSLEQGGPSRPPKLPPKYAQRLQQAAYDIWHLAPWEFLADRHILSIQLDRWDIGTLYVSVMGMLGREYGILLYRSLDSLKRFRSTAISEQSLERLEKAFLSQDCWFVNFETDNDDFDDEEDDLADLPLEEIYPLFGSVHPYEGMRPFLDEEEAIAVYVALEALASFIQSKRDSLARWSEEGELDAPLPALSKRCRISLPPESEVSETLSIPVATLPELAREFEEMEERAPMDAWEEDSSELEIPIRDDLIPDDALVYLDILPWNRIREMRADPKTHYPVIEADESGEGLPVAIIQISRPKVKDAIAQITANGGVKTISYNPGEDPFTETTYDLGLLQTSDGNLYLFKEFMTDDPNYQKARQKWERNLKKTKGYCGLILAMGAKGSSRGRPRPKDMLALFEARVISSEELGMETLQLIPQFSLELDF